MIGKIMTGKSFRGCLQYCLNDKTAGEKKNEPVMKNRAEVILYNKCFGNDKELIEQFNEVRWLNPKLSKPVLHVILSLGKGESLPANKLAEMAQDCAHELGFENNQYVAVFHKDTTHLHIHIVANRVGYDGKTVSDSNNYQKIAKLCRKLELKHELKQVLSPNAFLPRELRRYHRFDQRKEKLKMDIKTCLAGAENYQQFEHRMKALKYEVIKKRGIAFRDQQKVYTKGSEVGYSLATIENTLAQRQYIITSEREEPLKNKHSNERQQLKSSYPELEKNHQARNESMINVLFNPTDEFHECLNQALPQEGRKRRNKKRRRHL